MSRAIEVIMVWEVFCPIMAVKPSIMISLTIKVPLNNEIIIDRRSNAFMDISKKIKF
jgi:hypothetical protein